MDTSQVGNAYRMDEFIRRHRRRLNMVLVSMLVTCRLRVGRMRRVVTGQKKGDAVRAASSLSFPRLGYREGAIGPRVSPNGPSALAN